MSDPDFVYDPDNWECTYDWSDRSLLIEDDPRLRRARDIQRFETLVKGPPKYAAQVPTEFGEDGEVYDWEIRWFESEDAARRACGLPPRS